MHKQIDRQRSKRDQGVSLLDIILSSVLSALFRKKQFNSLSQNTVLAVFNIQTHTTNLSLLYTRLIISNPFNFLNLSDNYSHPPKKHNENSMGFRLLAFT